MLEKFLFSKGEREGRENDDGREKKSKKTRFFSNIVRCSFPLHCLPRLPLFKYSRSSLHIAVLCSRFCLSYLRQIITGIRLFLVRSRRGEKRFSVHSQLRELGRQHLDLALFL